MPQEAGRTTVRKIVKLPTGSTVAINVITKISFKDPNDRYQETQYTIDNSANGDRAVHVDNVFPTDEDGNVDTSVQPLKVERIDEFKLSDANDRGQETRITFDNVTGNDDAPPHFRTHEKTHVFRYYNNPLIPDDDQPWIDVEVIDQFKVKDANERGQETFAVLLNPDVQADPNDPNIADTDNGVDPPWRTDPFQNIVNWSGGSGTGGVPVTYLISASVFISGNTATAVSTVSDGFPQLYNNQTNGATFGDLAGLPKSADIPEMEGFHPGMTGISVSGASFIVSYDYFSNAPPLVVIPGGSVTVPVGPITFTEKAHTADEVPNNFEFKFGGSITVAVGVVTGNYVSGNLVPTEFNPELGKNHTGIEMFRTGPGPN